MARSMAIRLLGGSIAAMVTGPVGAGPDWTEMGDAGRLPATGQQTVGTGPLGTISGNLMSAGPGQLDLEDVYEIRIDDPAKFSARTVFQEGTNFNTQLWLFSLDELGVVGNDDAPDLPGPGSLLLPETTDGVPVSVAPGNYFLAVTGFDDDPVSQDGPIFLQKSPNEISGPDGPGGGAPIVDWKIMKGLDVLGTYEIILTGATFAVKDLCPADTNGDGQVDVDDLVNVILAWATSDPGADVNGDGFVDVDDLVEVILRWGPCPVGGCPGSGDCFQVQETPGCEDEACCLLVCGVDPYCCESMWDAACVMKAQQLCGGAVCKPDPGAPENDCCESPMFVNDPVATFPFDTTAANTDGPADPTNPCQSNGNDVQVWKDVWYLYESQDGGVLRVSVCFGPTFFNTKLIAYDLPGGLIDCATLVENTIDCNDDCEAVPPGRSELRFPVFPGQLVMVRLGGFSGTGTEAGAESGPGEIVFELLP